MNNDKVTIEELFATWKKELGYNKAVLISCCYPIKLVVSMAEEEAEGEVEAIGYSV